jgi:hypothetical protein
MTFELFLLKYFLILVNNMGQRNRRQCVAVFDFYLLESSTRCFFEANEMSKMDSRSECAERETGRECNFESHLRHLVLNQLQKPICILLNGLTYQLLAHAPSE